MIKFLILLVSFIQLLSLPAQAAKRAFQQEEMAEPQETASHRKRIRGRKVDKVFIFTGYFHSEVGGIYSELNQISADEEIDKVSLLSEQATICISGGFYPGEFFKRNLQKLVAAIKHFAPRSVLVRLTVSNLNKFSDSVLSQEELIALFDLIAELPLRLSIELEDCNLSLFNESPNHPEDCSYFKGLGLVFYSFALKKGSLPRAILDRERTGVFKKTASQLTEISFLGETLRNITEPQMQNLFLALDRISSLTSLKLAAVDLSSQSIQELHALGRGITQMRHLSRLTISEITTRNFANLESMKALLGELATLSSKATVGFYVKPMPAINFNTFFSTFLEACKTNGITRTLDLRKIEIVGTDLIIKDLCSRINSHSFLVDKIILDANQLLEYVVFDEYEFENLLSEIRNITTLQEIVIEGTASIDEEVRLAIQNSLAAFGLGQKAIYT